MKASKKSGKIISIIFLIKDLGRSCSQELHALLKVILLLVQSNRNPYLCCAYYIIVGMLWGVGIGGLLAAHKIRTRRKFFLLY